MTVSLLETPILFRVDASDLSIKSMHKLTAVGEDEVNPEVALKYLPERDDIFTAFTLKGIATFARIDYTTGTFVDGMVVSTNETQPIF